MPIFPKVKSLSKCGEFSIILEEAKKQPAYYTTRSTEKVIFFS